MKVFVWSKLKRHKYLSSFSDVTFVREVKVVLLKCPLIPAGLNGLTPEKKLMHYVQIVSLDGKCTLVILVVIVLCTVQLLLNRLMSSLVYFLHGM